MPFPLLAAALGGAALQVAGSYQQGQAAKSAAKFSAKQQQKMAGRDRAAAQRRAMEIDRQGRLRLSRALAVAAASGGGASDPTVMDLMADIAGDTAYERAVAMYEGETMADDRELQAQVDRRAGKEAAYSAKLGAIGTALSSGASLYNKYGLEPEGLDG